MSSTYMHKPTKARRHKKSKVKENFLQIKIRDKRWPKISFFKHKPSFILSCNQCTELKMNNDSNFLLSRKKRKQCCARLFKTCLVNKVLKSAQVTHIMLQLCKATYIYIYIYKTRIQHSYLRWYAQSRSWTTRTGFPTIFPQPGVIPHNHRLHKCSILMINHHNVNPDQERPITAPIKTHTSTQFQP
jgi:hypothetical protein